jgi:hypothetical protein
MAKGSSGSVTISVDQLSDRAKIITEIDSKIAAASGNDSQMRKAAVDEILSANAERINSLFDTVVSQLMGLPGEELVGIVSKLEEAMKGDFKTKTDLVIDEKVKASANVEGVDVNALKEQRKAELDLFRALKTMLDSLGLDTSEVEEPKSRGGGRPSGSGAGSKTGKNKEGYRYIMDGKDRPNSQNSFSSLAYYATEGLKDPATPGGEITAAPEGEKSRMSSKALRTWLDQQGVKFGEADEWELTLPNGKKIGARRDADSSTTEAAPTEAQSEEVPAA